MSDPFIGEVRMFAGSFAPAGWALCNGALIPISENDALFVLLGTTYGGDGEETFALPDLQGRVPMHNGQGPGISQNYQLGEKAGVESVTLSTQQIPVHNHAWVATTDPGQGTAPADQLLAANPTVLLYRPSTPTGAMNAGCISPVGGSQPHENLQPYITINYIISLFGIFPH
jgi:microcystin-dependent protein